MLWYNDSDYIPIATSQTPFQLLAGVEIMWTLLLTYDGFPQSSNYTHMQGDYSWNEWNCFFIWSNYNKFGDGHDSTKTCGAFCGKPFEDQGMAAKSLKEIMG